MTKFKARWNEIWRVEVERETEASVWVKGRRSYKSSSYDNYFDSFDEAKAFLVTEAGQEVERKKDALHRARTQLGNVQSLKASSVREDHDKR